MKTAIVIPARLQSTRLPEKLLLDRTGKPLIQHTYEAAQLAKLADRVIVAADDHAIVEAVEGFGGECILTSPSLPSGTDRVAVVAKELKDYELIVNVQGDEPEIAGESIDLAIEILQSDKQAVMSTLATPIRTREVLDDPARVKVVCDRDSRALYFSRSPMPFVRDWDPMVLQADPPLFLLHVGLYAYRKNFLAELSELEQTPLEKAESLEQLRVLENGHAIRVGLIDEPTVGIDTPGDYEAFVSRYGT